MVFPDGNSGNGNVPAWVLPFMGGNFGNNGGLFGGNNGWGGGILGFLLGLMFGNGGFGNFFGGNGWNNGNAGAGFLSNQINNDSGRELLMNAIVSQGEQARTAIQTLSTMLGQDFNLVNGAVQTIQTAINQIANNQGLNAMQIINSIQNGTCTLGRQICECCCNMQQTFNQGGDMNFRRSPRMRGGRGGGQGSYNMPRMRYGIGGYAEVPPHMRGYVVRPEDEDWMYNERYNW